jgi:hypothetical protein
VGVSFAPRRFDEFVGFVLEFQGGLNGSIQGVFWHGESASDDCPLSLTLSYCCDVLLIRLLKAKADSMIAKTTPAERVNHALSAPRLLDDIVVIEMEEEVVLRTMCAEGA